MTCNVGSFESLSNGYNKQEVLKAKKKFEEESDKLKDLYRKRDEGRKKELLEAVARSSRSFEEIIAFVQSDSDENE